MAANVDMILAGLDRLFMEHKMEEVEGYLLNALDETTKEGDHSTVITIVNELIGFYRDTSQYQKSLFYCNQILPFMKELGLEGSIPYATTCLNIANACRAAGELDKSLQFYKEVKFVYDDLLPEGDSLYASYYNNLSLLYQEMGDFNAACKALKKALSIVEKEGDKIKIATTCSNLGTSLLRIGDQEEAEKYLLHSLTIYIEDGEKDFHYGAALAAMGELQYRKKEYESSIKYYKKALAELEKHVGRTDFYYRTMDNLRTVEEALDNSKKDITGSQGRQRCIDFYVHKGKPMIEKKFPLFVNKIAIGIVGEGSHCFGFDDELSADHDFVPGFCMWVTRDTYNKIGEYLQAEYENLYQDGRKGMTKEAKARTGVCIIEDFYKRFLGENKLPEKIEDWISLEEAMLCTATNGIVLKDEEGIFTKIRERLLKYYPDQLWISKIAQEMYHLSQYGQYNYSRMISREDVVTAGQCRGFFIDSVMKMIYLLNRVYAPYYKWMFRGLENIDNFGIYQKLRDLSIIPILNKDDNACLMEEICILLLKQMEKIQLLVLSENSTYVADYISQVFLSGGGVYKKETGPSKEELVEEMVHLEWACFDKVKNMGGRAECQDDWNTFSLMRKSQYLTWTEEMISSYIKDFKEAWSKDWNLITEKYGRMMESTDQEGFLQVYPYLPVLPEKKMQIIEEIVKIQVQWMEEFARLYPYMANNGRVIHTYEDSLYHTSAETYLRGELSTYSDITLDLYGRFIVSYLEKDQNLTLDIMKNTALLYGYKSLEDAEEALKKEFLKG